ncbi:hypothetical protein E4U21_007027 [Claviceps maximensis]|nr:hypothetical protein E4U21_007027 [Claviceps maximensis]
MQLSSALFGLVTVSTVFADPHSRTKRGEKPAGKVDAGTASDCTYWEEKTDESVTCDSLREAWSISAKDFLDWNPLVKNDCSGIKVGNSYCVEVNYGVPPPYSTPTQQGGEPKPSPTQPSPTQPGLAQDCTDFYLAEAGDTCDKIVAARGKVTLPQFVAWNPAVGETCAHLWAGYYYCVQSAGPVPSSLPSPTKPAPSTGPSPTQYGIAKDCTAFYEVAPGDFCQAIVDKYRTFSLDSFLKWNPAVGPHCRALYVGYYVCVGAPEAATDKPTRPPGPSPTQEGIIKSCGRYYKAVSGDTCQVIVDKYRGSLQLNDFYKWNPAVKKGYYYCTGISAK